MLEKFNNWRERKAYMTYAKLNAERKAKEASNKVFKLFDDIRRRTGFVK